MIRVNERTLVSLKKLESTPEFQNFLAELRLRREVLVSDSQVSYGEKHQRIVGRISELDDLLELMKDPGDKLKQVRNSRSDNSGRVS
jgi:hypothetical protein